MNAAQRTWPSGRRGVRREERVGIIRWRRQLHSLWSLKAALPVLLLATLDVTAAPDPLEVLADNETQYTFTGEGRQISVRFRNPSASPVTTDLHTRLHQASSATTAPLGEAPWKKLTVLPGQTVLEAAAMTFPPVKAETRFLVQWLDGTNQVIGVTEVLGYPPDLLKELKPLAGDDPLGVLDPQNQLKPLLKAAAVEFQDLEDTGLENYHGKLAIIGPFQSRGQMRENLPNSLKALARKGVAVVWLQPPPEKRQELKPTFYTALEGKGAVVVVQAELVADLAEKPQAQLNLIQVARLALHPEPLQLPQMTRSP
jgi:hypothetical protein